MIQKDVRVAFWKASTRDSSLSQKASAFKGFIFPDDGGGGCINFANQIWGFFFF